MHFLPPDTFFMLPALFSHHAVVFVLPALFVAAHMTCEAVHAQIPEQRNEHCAACHQQIVPCMQAEASAFLRGLLGSLLSRQTLRLRGKEPGLHGLSLLRAQGMEFFGALL